MTLVIGGTSAAPGPVLNISRLVAGSDVIVTATVTRVSDLGSSLVSRPAGTISGRAMLAALRVDHVIKGPSNLTSIDVTFGQPDMPVGYRGIEEAAYRVVFLRRAGDRYTFADPYYPSLTAAQAAPIATADPLQAVLEAISNAVRSQNTAVQTKLEAIWELWGEKNAVVMTALRPALEDRDDMVRLTAAAALLAVNDLSGIVAAESALLNGGGDSDSMFLHNLRVGIALGVNNEAAIPTMARLLVASDARTRRAASSALRRMHSRTAIPILAEALDDADTEVKHTAVMAFAEFTGEREWGPNMMEFKADQQRYIEHWKNWNKR